MKRIAIAGFQHETNSFGLGPADLADFQMADSWPGLLEDASVLDETMGMNLPIAGFAGATAGNSSVELTPILWCAAEPSGPVTDHAFDTITARILDGIAEAGPLDAVYLDLHGAMITASHQDGEGEVLDRVRALIGADIPIAISLDFHANVTPQMVKLADAICIFRSYPHLDMAETGARAFHTLKRLDEWLTPGAGLPATAFSDRAPCTDDPCRACTQSLCGSWPP